MVEASVVETSFLLAAESTKGGGGWGWGGSYSGGVVFLGGVSGSSMWVVRRMGAPDDVVL